MTNKRIQKKKAKKKLTREQILEANEDKRSRCTIYTRVMGYHRPVESFNIGKKGEYDERKWFERNRK